ncbi:hypothetical protein DCC85_13030 [Paenibacillus sp. CAA11]|nr:hypothetical protein DCC85_13030 [Paenibacillus sp. CAA11]
MLQQTEQLIQLLSNQIRTPAAILESYCRVIALYGGQEDAAALFELFCNQPEDYRYTMLLGPVMRCGDLELAEEMDHRCFEQNKLKPNMPSEILHVLGYMGYEKYTDYMMNCVETDDWHLSKDACLGLMHLPISKQHQERLRNELEKAYGQPLFSEFLPALCCKFSGPDIVPRLVAWGDEASTDCNAGLLLGIAAYGEDQRDCMKQILWNPGWELYSTGTGSHWWAYIAMQMVKLTFHELISDVKEATPLELENRDLEERAELIEHQLWVLHDLLELRLSQPLCPLRFVPETHEKLSDLYTQLFAWSTEHQDDSITGRIGHYFGVDHPLADKYLRLATRMEEGIFRELEHGAWTDCKDKLSSPNELQI